MIKIASYCLLKHSIKWSPTKDTATKGSECNVTSRRSSSTNHQHSILFLPQIQQQKNKTHILQVFFFFFTLRVVTLQILVFINRPSRGDCHEASHILLVVE